MLISRKDLKLILNFGFSGIIIFGVHYFLLHVFNRQLYVPNILLVHPFLLSVTVLAAVGVKIVFKKVKMQVLGYAFMATSVIKMFLSLAFLYPTLSGDSLFKKEYVLQFFTIYFIYLTVEVYYLVRDFKSELK